jgi:hypothetical protein
MPLPTTAGPDDAGRGSAFAGPSPSSGRRVDVLLTLAIVFGLLGFVAIRPLLRRLAKHPSPEQCAAMLDRYAEQEAQAAAPSRPPPDSPPPSPAQVERCARELTAEEVGCALKANNIDEIERCLP